VSTATVTLTVKPVDDLPIAVDDALEARKTRPSAARSPATTPLRRRWQRLGQGLRPGPRQRGGQPGRQLRLHPEPGLPRPRQLHLHHHRRRRRRVHRHRHPHRQAGRRPPHRGGRRPGSPGRHAPQRHAHR
jgi:hypothetical protein